MTAKTTKETQIINAIGKNYPRIALIILTLGVVIGGIVFALLFSVQTTGTSIKTQSIQIEPAKAGKSHGTK